MKLPIVSYAHLEIFAFTIITIALSIALAFLYYPLVIIPVLLFIFMLYFFRDPARNVPEDNNLILSPADGRIIDITDVYENIFLQCEAVKIAIFLSVWNVHINRAPCGGQVALISYQPGKFLVASNPQASEVNESNAIGIINHQAAGLRVLVRQIAGIIAQRIVCACRLNDSLRSGQKIGMIKFGSRTEIFIPKSRVAEITVKLKDKVKAGESILANLVSEGAGG